MISAGREQAERDDRAAGTDRHVQFTATGRIRLVLVFMMAIAEDVANGDSAKRALRLVGNTPYFAVVIPAATEIAIGRSRTGRPLPRDVGGRKRVRDWYDAGRCRDRKGTRLPSRPSHPTRQ